MSDRFFISESSDKLLNSVGTEVAALYPFNPDFPEIFETENENKPKSGRINLSYDPDVLPYSEKDLESMARAWQRFNKTIEKNGSFSQYKFLIKSNNIKIQRVSDRLRLYDHRLDDSQEYHRSLLDYDKLNFKILSDRNNILKIRMKRIVNENNLSISARDLGGILFVFFSSLLIASGASNRIYIDPIVGAMGVITSLAFYYMDRINDD